MQKKITRLLMLFVVLISFTSCSVIEGIFKAGVGVGIFIVVAIIAIIVLIISKVFGKK
jgi:lipopolysaccharide export LptBFGC system permease protein LptF